MNKVRLTIAIGIATSLQVGCSSDVGPTTSVGNSGAPGAGQPGAGAASIQGGGGAGGAAAAGASAGGASNIGGGGSSGASAGPAGSGGNGGSSAGASGTSGTAGSGGSSGAKPSAGCGMPAGQTLKSWVEQPKLPINGKDRQWWVWLPNNYDPTRAYPIVFTFHGCGGAGGYEPMQNVTGDDAIVVRGLGGDPGNGGCWQYPGTADDVKFWDAMLADVESKHCADTSRVFLTGYSSGSWFANTLDCIRGDKIRATGTVSGGVVGNRGTCTTSKYARLFIHDIDDTTNYFEDVPGHSGQGNKQEVARIVAQNSCMPDNPQPVSPAPCVQYQGCSAGYPVILCRTTGKMHDMQVSYATAAFWQLFKSL